MSETFTDADREWVLKLLADPERGRVLAVSIDPRQRWLADVARLQPAAVAKLGPPPAGIWWVTDRSLQQATAGPVAELKASWSRDFGGQVADVCCGIGSDFVRWAAGRQAIAVDRDPRMLAMAAANLEADAASKATFQAIDVETIPVEAWMPAGGMFHLDPDRRAGRARRTDWHQFSPGPDFLERLNKRSAGGVVKLAPATELPDDWSDRSHRTWISLGGTVREQSILLGNVLEGQFAVGHALDLAGRSAISIRRGRTDVLVNDPSDPDPGAEEADRLGRWMIDPDASVRAAGLTATLARRWSARTVGGLPGFLTADELLPEHLDSSLAIVRRVIEPVPAQLRRMRRRFREAGWFAEAVKIRGGGEDPAEVQRSLRVGDRPVGLWLGPARRGRLAVVTEPIATVPAATDLD